MPGSQTIPKRDRVSVKAVLCVLVISVGHLGTVSGQSPDPRPADHGPHQTSNPVYRELIEPGDGDSYRLPVASLVEGQSAEQQRETIQQMIGNKYDLEAMLRPSVVAPHLLKMDREPYDESTISMRAAVYFAGQGDLHSIADGAFMNALVQSDDEADSRELTEDELTAAGVETDQREPRQEYYHLVRGNLFDRVQFQGVTRSYWTRTDDSILLALTFDDRFSELEGLQPSWVRFERASNGDLEPVERGFFKGGGLYIKMTQLKNPADRLFVEAQLVLLEPKAWFGGANLLGSKLPPAIQSQVREIRRKALRASQQADTSR